MLASNLNFLYLILSYYLLELLGLNLSNSYFDRVSLPVHTPSRNCPCPGFSMLDLMPAGIVLHLLHLIVDDLDLLGRPLEFHWCYYCSLRSFLSPLSLVSCLLITLLAFSLWYQAYCFLRLLYPYLRNFASSNSPILMDLNYDVSCIIEIIRHNICSLALLQISNFYNNSWSRRILGVDLCIALLEW
jgi:hypothetical protein